MFFPRKDHDGEATYLFFADTQPKGHIPDVIACLATDDPESLDSGFNQSPRPSALLMEHSRGLFSRPGLIGYRIQNGGFVDHTVSRPEPDGRLGSRLTTWPSRMTAS